jgi:perosamine synthetase
MSTKQVSTTSSTPFSVSRISDVLKTVLQDCSVPPTLHQPLFDGNELKYVTECIETGWVSSVGAFVDRFEAMLSEFTGARRAVAVVNGTAALHLALKIAGVQHNDEVLVPALTFVATANAVSYCGAIPHFVDSSYSTLGLDPEKLERYLNETVTLTSEGSINRHTGRRIRAVVPMHTFGHPVDLDPLLEVCARYQLEMVEDAAESLGSYYKGRHTGRFGRVGVLSFNGNKVVTTGGGGCLLFEDEELGRLAKHLSTTARVSHRWEFFHDMIGFNYRMPNLNAALGCAQLENLPRFLERKRALADRYRMAFQEVTGVSFVDQADFGTSNWWLNAIILDSKYAGRRNELLDAMNRDGIVTRPVWTLMHRLPMYSGCPRMDLSVAEDLETRLINIPSSVSRKLA